MKNKTATTVTRFSPSKEGLTSEQVKQRVAEKLTNKTKKVVGKSYLSIFASNVFTFFNLLGFIIFLLMLLCKSVTNMMFIVIILANTVIGIFQEIRSKRAVEKLSIVSEPTATAVRDGKEEEIATRDIVLDDILIFSSGRQICTDSVVLEGEVEGKRIHADGGKATPSKSARATCFTAAATSCRAWCVARCDKVGKENYVEQLSERVKKSKTPNSQLIKGIKSIIKVISVIIFPLGIATFFSSAQVRGLLGEGVNLWQNYVVSPDPDVVYQINEAIKAMSGSMIGMVPSGMVLLTSVALAVAALKLALKKVLVRELPCIEMLARVGHPLSGQDGHHHRRHHDGGKRSFL